MPGILKSRRSSRPSPILPPRAARRGMSGAQGAAAAAAVAGGDWRSQLPPQARGRIVNKITETLKKHLPVPVTEAQGICLGEIQNIAARFEERMYTVATSEADYLRKISLKVLSMERAQNPQNAHVIPNQ